MRVGEAIECTVTTRTAILALFCMQCLLWDSYSRLKADVKVLQEGQVPASSSTRMKRDTYKEANVEFIHPKLREEMGSQKGDPENPWVWLTSYSRIPVKWMRMGDCHIFALFFFSSSLKLSKTFAQPPKSTALQGRRGLAEKMAFQAPRV